MVPGSRRFQISCFGRGDFRAFTLILAIALCWLLLTAVSCFVYLAADDWACLERLLDHGILWSFNPAVKGRLFYRPLTQDLYYRGMSALFGFNPVPYHLFNMFLQAANIILVFLLARRLTGRRDAALWASLFFIANPGSFLIINFIAGIQEISQTFLALAAVLLFLRAGDEQGRERRGFLGLAALCYGLSLFAKETVFWVPLWLWVYDLARGAARGESLLSTLRARFRFHVPFDLLMALYLGMRLVFMPPPAEGAYLFSPFGPHVFDRLEDCLRVGFKSLGLPALESASRWHFYTFLCALGAAATLPWWRRRAFLGSCVFLGFAWFVLGILVFLPLEQRFYEYYISFALIGPGIAAGHGLELALNRTEAKSPGLAKAVFAAALMLALGSSAFHHFQEQKRNLVVNLARATREIHRGIKARYPDFPRNARIIMFTDFRLGGDPSHLGLRALYHRPDLQVILDEQAYRIGRRGRKIVLVPRADFDYRGVYGFIYTEKTGLIELRIGPDGSVPFSVELPGG